MQETDLKIIKRDGKKEAFDLSKVKNVMKAAGLTDEESEKVANNIFAWTKTQNKSEFTSIEIRDRVIIELEGINSYIAGLFKWYQSTRTEAEFKNGN